jgi:DNA invertase Pin-like site-specific DNA recombinase
MAVKLVAYLRAPARPPASAGPELAAQRAAVEAYRRQAGARVAAWYTEAETGRRCQRPELARALAHARRGQVTLCIARLGRLVRDAAFLARLADAAVDFVACDLPAVTPAALPVLAAVAQAEARAAGARVKAGLAAAKARGTLLGAARPGHWQGREAAHRDGVRKAQVAAARARAEAADRAYAGLLPALIGLRAERLSLQAVADRLNRQGLTTRRGRPWNPVQVSRVLDRAKARSSSTPLPSKERKP